MILKVAERRVKAALGKAEEGKISFLGCKSNTFHVVVEKEVLETN